jgi:hypothetical protein
MSSTEVGEETPRKNAHLEHLQTWVEDFIKIGLGEIECEVVN